MAKGRSTASETGTAGHSGQWPTVSTTHPSVINRHDISDEELEMLATLRRSRWDEFTWAAITGLISVAPVAIDAFYQAFFAKAVKPLEVIGVLYIAATAVFAVVFFLALKWPRDKRKSAADLVSEIRARNKTITRAGGSGGAE